MSIEELGELTDGIKGLDFTSALREQKITGDVESAFKNFKDQLPKNFLDGELTYEKSNAHVKLKNGDRLIDLSKTQSELTLGNFEGVLKELGVDTNTAESKQFISERSTSFRESSLGKFRDAFKTAESLPEKYKIPDLDDVKSYEDLKNKLPKEMRDRLDAANKDLKKMQEDNKNASQEEKEKAADSFYKKYGKGIIKTILGLAAATAFAFGVYDLYELIKKTRDAMAGCWSYNTTSTCKVAAMTCDDDDLINPGGSDAFNLCTACTTINCPVGDWIPLLPSKAKSCDPSGKADYPGCYDYTLPSGENTCVQPYKDTCSTNTQFACANASGCISRSEACANKMNSDCAAWCSTDIAMIQSGQSFECKNVSMATAMGSVFENLFDIPSNFLGALKKIFIIIVLFIVGIIVLYGLWKLVSWLWGKYSERKANQQNEADELKRQLQAELQRSTAYGQRALEDIKAKKALDAKYNDDTISSVSQNMSRSAETPTPRMSQLTPQITPRRVEIPTPRMNRAIPIEPSEGKYGPDDAVNKEYSQALVHTPGTIKPSNPSNIGITDQHTDTGLSDEESNSDLP